MTSKIFLQTLLTPGGSATKTAIETAIKLGTAGYDPQLHCDKNSRKTLLITSKKYTSCPTHTNCRTTIYLPL